MGRLRVLTAIPLVAGLLFAGAASTAAQSGAPVIPGVPSMNLPYVDAGFNCFSPEDNAPSGTEEQLVTDESFVFLMSQATSSLPSIPGAVMGQGMDLNFMKCFFHYRHGTVPDAPYVGSADFCAYPPKGSGPPPAPTANGHPRPYHVFAHSRFIVRDTFAILMCWGTSTCQVQVGTNSQTCCDVATVANEPQICPPTQGSSTTSAARRTALAAARPASRTVDRRLR
jgi:hypothetical protein